jgi:hypothetical protein
VPFHFGRKKDDSLGPGAGKGAPAAAATRTAAGIAFDGLTEEWRLVGRMHIEGRLSDVLNRREAIPIGDVQWAPVDGSGTLTPVPGLKSVDPYDLIVVLAGEGTLPPLSESEKAAYKVHKVAYDVALEAPPFRVIGTVYLFPGTEPDRLLDRSTEMFVPVTDAQAFLGGVPIGGQDVDVVLVNRFYLRGVEQIDKRTNERVKPLPGMPLGGVSYSDRSR